MYYLSSLTVILVVLKLLGYNDWSWWLIMVPMFVLAFLFAVLVYGTRQNGTKIVLRVPFTKKYFEV